MGVNEKVVAQTGAPHWLSKRLTPMVRRKVVLPDILEPVTSMSFCDRPTVQSFATRSEAGISGWARPVVSIWSCWLSTGVGQVKEGLLKDSAAREFRHSMLPTASIHSWNLSL